MGGPREAFGKRDKKVVVVLLPVAFWPWAGLAQVLRKCAPSLGEDRTTMLTRPTASLWDQDHLFPSHFRINIITSKEGSMVLR